MLNPDFRDILSALSEEGVECLLVGAYAVAAHGLPRATGDIDIWVQPSPTNAERVWKALIRFGAPLTDLNVEDFTIPGRVVQIGVAPCRIDLLTTITAVAFDEAWRDRLVVDVDGLRVAVISRDHLIRNKKMTGRPQDKADVARLEGKGFTNR